MAALFEALSGYPPSLLTVLLALGAPFVLLVGVAMTLMRKEGGRGLAIGTTGGAAAMVLLALFIQTYGASAGVTDSIEGMASADPSMRSMLMSRGIATSLWAAALGAGIVSLLVPAIAFGGALVWGVRNKRDEKPVLPPVLVALGVSGPSFLAGSFVLMKVSGFIRMFGAVAYADPHNRAALIRAGLEEIDYLLAGGIGIAILFALGFALAAAGAVLAARKNAIVGDWAVGMAAAFALFGVTSATLLEVRASSIDELRTVLEMQAPASPDDAPDDVPVF